MIVATTVYDDGTDDLRAFDTRASAVRFAEEECKWEGTVSVVLEGYDKEGTHVLIRHEGEFV